MLPPCVIDIPSEALDIVPFLMMMFIDDSVDIHDETLVT